VISSTDKMKTAISEGWGSDAVGSCSDRMELLVQGELLKEVAILLI